MTEHPTINIGEEELELIELHRTKTALEEKQKSLDIDLQHILAEHPEISSSPIQRELDIVEGALKTIEKILSKYEDKYGEQKVKSMVT